MTWTFAGVPWETLAPIGGVAAAALVTLYVLRLRRQRVEVPFSPLWQQVLQERSASRLWDRLKRLLSLLLQLALLGLIVLALADPQSDAQRREGRSVVIVLDASASMSAGDEEGGRGRFERAVEHVRDAIARLGPRDEAMLVVMDRTVRPLTPFVRDPAALERALVDVAPSDTPGDLGEALHFAGDALRDRPRAHLVVATDGAGQDAPTLALPAHVALHLHPVGRSGDNVGITAFNVRRYPANRTDFEVYVRVENFADAPAEVELSVWAEGSMSARQTLTLDAGASATRLIGDVPAAGDELEARVRVVAGDVVDVFALDDVAYARVPEARPLRVLAVTPGNLYLEGPLLLNPSLDVSVIAPEAYAAPNAGDPSAGFDVTLFDGVTPPVADRGNFLYFAPSGPNSPWARDAAGEGEDDAGSEIDDPIIHSAQAGHPLLRWISALRDVNIAAAERLHLERDDRVVASAIGGAPMLVTREEPGRRLAALAFDVQASDLPLRVAWPVFLLNALDWFTRDDASLLEAYRTGETWFVPLGDRDATEVTVVSPSGTRRVLPAVDGFTSLFGDEVGFWEVTLGERTWSVAGNLASSEESSIAPNAAAWGDLDAPAFDDASLHSVRDPWVLLVLAALGILLLEWLTWNRRWTV